MSRAAKIAAHWALDYRFALTALARDVFEYGLRLESTTDHGSQDSPPIVIVPGIFERASFMRPLVHRLEKEGHRFVHVPGLRFNGTSILKAAEVLSAFLEENDLRDVIVLAHSKGGLIAKQAMTTTTAAKRIAHTIAIATPFNGSMYATPFPMRSVREFSPSSPVMRSLISDTSANERITSIYASFDPHIPAGCELQGAAANIRVSAIGHYRIVTDPEVQQAVVDALTVV